MARMESATKSIKLSFLGETIRLPFREPVELSAVLDAVTKQWGLRVEAFALTYKDDDGDTVTISSADGMAEALAHHTGPLLRLSVVSKESIIGKIFRQCILLSIIKSVSPIFPLQCIF